YSGSDCFGGAELTLGSAANKNTFESIPIPQCVDYLRPSLWNPVAIGIRRCDVDRCNRPVEVREKIPLPCSLIFPRPKIPGDWLRLDVQESEKFEILVGDMLGGVRRNS